MMKYLVFVIMMMLPMTSAIAQSCSELLAQCKANWAPFDCGQGSNPDRVYVIRNGQEAELQGYCTPDCPSAGTNKSTGYYDWGTSESALPTSTACDANCETSYSGSGINARRMVNGVYHYFSQGSYDYTGQTCSTGQPSPGSGQIPDNSCNPTTQDTGQVNGVTVCLDKPQPDTSTTTTTPPTTDPATGNTTTTTSNTTNNTTNNTTTTTTTTTTTSPDGTQTTSSQTSTNPTDPAKAAADKTFCQANPTDPSCNAPTDACKKNPDLVGCHNLGTPTPMEAIPTNVLPVDATVTAVGGGGMCPAPANLSFMGSALTWSYQPICDFAAMIRPLIIGFAWLSFGLIVAAGVKK